MASDDRETDHVIHSLAYRGPSLPKDANSFKEFYCRILAFFIIVLFSYLYILHFQDLIISTSGEPLYEGNDNWKRNHFLYYIISLECIYNIGIISLFSVTTSHLTEDYIRKNL